MPSIRNSLLRSGALIGGTLTLVACQAPMNIVGSIRNGGASKTLIAAIGRGPLAEPDLAALEPGDTVAVISGNVSNPVVVANLNRGAAEVLLALNDADYSAWLGANAPPASPNARGGNDNVGGGPGKQARKSAGQGDRADANPPRSASRGGVGGSRGDANVSKSGGVGKHGAVEESGATDTDQRVQPGSGRAGDSSRGGPGKSGSGGSPSKNGGAGGSGQTRTPSVPVVPQAYFTFDKAVARVGSNSFERTVSLRKGTDPDDVLVRFEFLNASTTTFNGTVSVFDRLDPAFSGAALERVERLGNNIQTKLAMAFIPIVGWFAAAMPDHPRSPMEPSTFGVTCGMAGDVLQLRSAALQVQQNEGFAFVVRLHVTRN